MNLAPQTALPVSLYWHCWNLHSVVIDQLTKALAEAAAKVLNPAENQRVTK